MGSFKSFGRKGYGNNNRGGFGGNRDDQRPSMHQATCASCGKQCEVPFKPTGDRPVFCKECFSRERGEDRPHTNKSFSRPSFGDSKPKFQPQNDQYAAQLASINVKLDKIMSAIMPPAAVVEPAMTMPAIGLEPKSEKAKSKVKAKKVSPKKKK